MIQLSFYDIMTENNGDIVSGFNCPHMPLQSFQRLMLPPSVATTHIQERLRAQMHNTHFLYPRPQVWRALIEASVLDEMFLALWAHGTTVIPVEVVQVGVIVVGFFSGVGRAACIAAPRRALGGGKEEEIGVTLCR